MRRRLDADLVRRGLAPDLDSARLLIDDRRVLVSGAVADKPGRQVAAHEPLRLVPEPPRFVSRAGQKLDAAIARFGVVVAGRRAIDAGASTGGFTDCLLQRGARAVVAVDVGYGQLHERVATDPRVAVVDRTNIRVVDVGAIGGPAEVVVADLSFISLRSVAAALVALAAPGADLVVLVKPQFEASRAEVDRGRGIIVDPAVWARVLEEVIAALRDRGATIMGVMASPITGSDGNVEFVLHARAPGGARSEGRDHRALDRSRIEAVVRDAAPR